MKRPDLDRTESRGRRAWTTAVAIVVFIAAASAADLSARPQEASAVERLTLSEAVARARETYPSLAAARAGEEASAAAVGEATADRWPELRAQANLTRFQEPMLVAPLHGFDISTPPEFDQTLIRGDVSFAWTVYDGGARGARIRAARAEAVGAGATRQAADMALITRTARVYLEILATHGVLEAQDRRIAALEAEGSRVRQFLEQGRAAAVELLRVQAALADARAGRVATATRLDLAERQLGRLIDVPVDSVRASRLVSLSLAPAADLEDRAELVARAQAASPELERSRQAVIAAEAARRAAIAAWIPKLSLFGGYLGFSGFGGDLTAEWQAGIGVSYPLFTGGGRSAATRTAEARARRAREELQLAELEIADRVDAALNAALETRARVEAVAEGVQHQSEVVRIELLSLEAGAGTQTDYLRAEADLMRVRSALVEARHAEIAARVELARALGELTPEWLAENLENVR